ncbi:hypothetical protein SAMN05444321_7683 [Bradyrhizobium lablabi]|nr:hypothetical protein SAMN05444321_7683 [Bradyrhizobium lablabi]
MPEMVYWACGHGFVHPLITPRPMLDFLQGKSIVFDCAAIGAMPANLDSSGIFFRLHAYLGSTVSFLWRMTSVRYESLWPLVSALVGGYASGCFVLVRLFFTRWFAIAGAIVLSLSPVMLSMVPYFRDFAKAPFFIWALVFLIMAVRAKGSRLSLLWAGFAGLAVGIGFGFRSDIIILLPIGIVGLTVGLGPKAWGARIAATAIFITSALLFASPILKAGKGGSFGTLVMQGLSDPFQTYLDLGSAPYSFGSRYSDELVLSSVAADLRTDDRDWDTREGQLGHSISQAVSRSDSYVVSWLPYFAGDFATQALKSAAWVIVFPELVAPGRLGQDPGVPVRAAPNIVRATNPLYDRLAHPWMAAVCAVGFIVFFWRVAVRTPREAFTLFLMFGALLTYPVVQFSIRHVFHLEFVWVLAVLSFLRFPFEWSKLRKVMPGFLITVIVTGLLVISVRVGMTLYQDQSLRHQLNALLSEPREAVDLVKKPVTNEMATFGLPLPSKYRALVEGAADSMTPRLGEQGLQWDVRAAADRMLLTFGGESCQPGAAKISFQYAKREGIWQPLDHAIIVPLPKERGIYSTVLIPAFYRPTQYLSGVSIPSEYSSCLVKAERVIGQTGLPVILEAVLLPDWRERSLHRAFGGFSLSLNR